MGSRQSSRLSAWSSRKPERPADDTARGRGGWFQTLVVRWSCKAAANRLTIPPRLT